MEDNIPPWKQNIMSKLKDRDNANIEITDIIQSLDLKKKELQYAHEKIRKYETIIKKQYNDDINEVRMKLINNMDELNQLQDKHHKLMKLYKDCQYEIRKRDVVIENGNKKIKQLDKDLKHEIEQAWDLYHEKMVLLLENNVMKQKYENSDFELL